MALKILAGGDGGGYSGCSGGHCPTVYEVDQDTLLVQGFVAEDLATSLDLPNGEQVVRIPRSLLKDLVGKL